MTCRVDPTSFGINYGSISLANFLATLYFVFYVEEGLRPSYRSGTKYNVATKLAILYGAIVYANSVGPTLVVGYPSCF